MIPGPRWKSAKQNDEILELTTSRLKDLRQGKLGPAGTVVDVTMFILRWGCDYIM